VLLATRFEIWRSKRFSARRSVLRFVSASARRVCAGFDPHSETSECMALPCR
jgi:hypothetical protein